MDDQTNPNQSFNPAPSTQPFYPNSATPANPASSTNPYPYSSPNQYSAYPSPSAPRSPFSPSMTPISSASPTPAPTFSAPSVAPAAPGIAPPLASAPLQSKTPATPSGVKTKSDSFLGMLVLLVISVLALVFLGLFVWAFIQWNTAKTNVKGQIDDAVAKAVNAKARELNDSFLEREKSPLKSFAGPTNYGGLSFKYPKTWNLYVAQDASHSEDYLAFFKPDFIPSFNDDQIYALRLSILNKSFDTVIHEYEEAVKQKQLTARVHPVNGINANIYDGKSAAKLNVRVAIFPIRDKTVILRTDANIYKVDFDKLLSTITFNK